MDVQGAWRDSGSRYWRFEYQSRNVNLNLNKKTDLSKACVWKYELWRHADEDDVKREEAIDNLVGMLKRLIERAQTEKVKLAPFIGIGCPA